MRHMREGMRSRENYATSFLISRCIFNVDSYDIFSDLLCEIRRIRWIRNFHTIIIKIDCTYIDVYSHTHTHTQTFKIFNRYRHIIITRSTTASHRIYVLSHKDISSFVVISFAPTLLSNRHDPSWLRSSHRTITTAERANVRFVRLLIQRTS